MLRMSCCVEPEEGEVLGGLTFSDRCYQVIISVPRQSVGRSVVLSTEDARRLARDILAHVGEGDATDA